MKAEEDILTGEIENICTEDDKLRFFLDACRDYGIPANETVAIGDSRSDHPIFRNTGKSIAINADTETKKLSTYSVDTDNLLDILTFCGLN
jgi:phosphoserine phosphatase